MTDTTIQRTEQVLLEVEFADEDTRTEIRQLYVRGSREFGAVALAKQFGITHTTILKIINE